MRRALWLLLPLVAVGSYFAGRVTARPQQAAPTLADAPASSGPSGADLARAEPPPGAATGAATTSQPRPVPTPDEMRGSVAPLVDRVKSAVVAIHSTKFIRRVVREDPFTQYLRERMGLGEAPARREAQRSLGSGFIIDAQGTVLTNNHVVAGADEVEVQLDDDRVLPARVIGSDPLTDVAVVKIPNPPRDLRIATLGDSDRLRVGDYVLAIGNPLGLGQTVTMGIVSAKNRSLGEKLGDIDPRFQDFIQTDAAINQGNSGGPLFNFAGEVVGINSAILNPAVAMNVGFAIPMNLAREVSRQIQANGRVTRGYLGVRSEDLTAERARELGIPFEPGAVLNLVERGSPADQAGLRVGDVIVEIGGRKIDRKGGLGRILGAVAAGEKVKIVALRGRERVETSATLTENLDLAPGDDLQVLGIRVRALTPNEARERGVKGQGLLVVRIAPRGPTSGELQVGDVLLGVGREPASLQVLQQFEQVLVRGGWGRLLVQRAGQTIVITLAG